MCFFSLSWRPTKMCTHLWVSFISLQSTKQGYERFQRWRGCSVFRKSKGCFQQCSSGACAPVLPPAVLSVV